MGRPSKYKPECAEQAYKLCLLGATNDDLANFFEVATSTVDKWIAEIEEFSGSVKRGREIADSEVADRLFKRATGYEHPEDDIRAVNGQIVITPTVKRYAPDTTAAIFWLKNRQRDRWRDKQEHEHTGKDGGPIETADVSERDLARRIAFVLAKATKE
jgi:hypothetical protein